jgi:hypothetical protein
MEIAQESEAGRTGGCRAILTQVSRPGQAPRPVSHLCCRERVDGEPSRTAPPVASLDRIVIGLAFLVPSFVKSEPTGSGRAPSVHLALTIGNAYRNPAISALEVEVAGPENEVTPDGQKHLNAS